jgi:glutamyl-Q tRNA(Asp) synthetase
MAEHPYIGRFAPSPTGPLHAGSLVAALASRLDALAHGGRWLLRIEDLDPPREVPGAAEDIIRTLAAFGFTPDGPIVFQSRRHPLYQQAFDRLRDAGWVYPCGCTRKEIADSLQRQGDAPERHRERIYPGTCRHGLRPGQAVRAWRVRVDDIVVRWHDESLGDREEALARSVGDFVLRRADGLWAYQLAVVVDDALQGVTHVVRGDDLLGATARQIHLQQRLGWPQPVYRHLPVVTDARGDKLSKQTGAAALRTDQALPALEQALAHLGIAPTGARSLDAFWRQAVPAWAAHTGAAH